uniref:Rankinidine/humantenine-11-hydroxylase 3 n=1 Tax=Gelsemium sempervirens TaxID=28542 RepID=A0A346A6F9_GELSE|nr:rankinidine/humantenine-11-hydroxylase 3 [Gelsemium sempervirens]
MELIIFLAVFLFFCSMVVKHVKKSKPVKLPPGPKPLPIIGNIHQLSGGLPHHILADMAKKYGPLMHLKLGEVSYIVLSSAEVAKEVMNQHDILFSSRPELLSVRIIDYNCTNITFSPYGDYWRQLRKICTVELLSAKRVQTFRSLREEEVLNMIKLVFHKKGSVVNLSKMVFSVTYSIIAQAAFGKRSKYQEEFLVLMEEIMNVTGGFSIADLYPSIKILEVISGMRQRLEKIHKKTDIILGNILDEHKEKRNRLEARGDQEAREDLIDILLSVQNSGEFGAPLTDDNIKAVISDIYAAGGESSATTAIWTMSEMIKNPGVLKRAQDEVRQVFDGKGNVDESGLHELQYMQAAIKETMRIHPALPLLLPRECRENCETNGYEIPVKTRVIVNAWAIGRDPIHWDDPDKFNPDRFLGSQIDFRGKDFSYIPFGAGRRMCPGITFALPNVQLPLAQLLFHFDWKLPGGLELEKLDMTENFGLAVGRKHDLELIPIPYSRSSVK